MKKKLKNQWFLRYQEFEFSTPPAGFLIFFSNILKTEGKSLLFGWSFQRVGAALFFKWIPVIIPCWVVFRASQSRKNTHGQEEPEPEAKPVQSQQP